MKTYKGYQFKPAVADLIRKVCKELKLKDVQIIWTWQITTAGIDNGGRLFLADVADDARLNDIDLAKYCGFGVHELLHRKYTDFNVRGSSDYLRSLHNAVEDAWIEHRGIDTLITGNVRNLLSTLIDGMVDRAMAEVTDWADPRQYPFALAVYLRKHAARKIPLAGGVEPIFAQAAVKLTSASSSADTLVIAQWVFDQLKALQPPQGQAPQDGTPTPPDGPTGDDQGEGEGEGAGQEKNAPEPSNEVGHGSAPTDDTEPTQVEPKLDEPSFTGGTYSEDNFVVEDYYLEPRPWLTVRETVPAKLRYTVKRLFDNSGLDEFARNRKSGAVNVHALPSVGYNDKLFKRRTEVDGIDSAVAIVVDVSSSMDDDGGKDKTTGRGNRITTAVQAAIALVDTLNRAGVATTVLAFATRTEVIKPFGTNATKGINDLRRLQCVGSTNDYFAVRYAHKLLLTHPAQRKVCFVLTDGQGNIQGTRDQVRIGARLGVTTIGVGIGLDVSGVYDNNVLVNDLSQLGAVSFDKIKLVA